MKDFLTERTAANQVFPFPEDKTEVNENPPVLVWLAQEGDPIYTVTVRDDEGNTVFTDKTKNNYIEATGLVAGKEYLWSIKTDASERAEQSFRLSEHPVIAERPTAEEVFSGIINTRPRHLFYSKDIPEILKNNTDKLLTLRRNVAQAYKDGLPPVPEYAVNPEAKLGYREYFGLYRDYCDRNAVACALLYSLTGDSQAGQFAKELFMRFCSFDLNSVCALNGSFGDEVGLSNARCFPSLFDMLYPLFSQAERKTAADAVVIYARQCLARLKKLDFCRNPGDSHAGRIPAYLGEAALVLKYENTVPESELREWLSYALEIYEGIFPHYGTPDGGWAEGPFYATSYTKWYIPFFSAVERYSGKSLLSKAFYHNFTRYLIHFASPYNEIHPFGDGYWCGSDDDEWPGFFAQDPFGFYAKRFGPCKAVEYSDMLSHPDIYRLHLLDLFLPEPKKKHFAQDDPQSGIFPVSGLYCFHTDPGHPADDISLIIRAGKYGSDSHRHPDQGSFAIFVGGTALISPSGYFGRAYGSLHHMKWLNSTKAHNCILIDGAGQPARSFKDRAKVIYCDKDENGDYKTVIDLSEAYPMLVKCIRTITLKDSSVSVSDEIEAENEITVTECFHALSPFSISDGLTAEETRKSHSLIIKPVSGDYLSATATNVFDTDINAGSDGLHDVYMPPQYHLYYVTKKARSFVLSFRLDIS